jgi:eukaryotic-like serine/threonine-protein kinase
VKYNVVGLLGRGGSAVVELAVDADGHHVATKRLVLTGSAAEMHVARQRLRREAEILGRLAHPGIVPIIEVIDDGSEVVLVLPALAENLDDRVRRLGPLPSDEVVRIGRVLLGALAAAHRQGVVHRDIKPANVLFDSAGRPALADFGIAVTRDVTAGLTQAGSVIGTPMWMAPEQARGEPAGPASDVFSLAATLTFAATGEGPYEPGLAIVVLGRAARDEIRPVAPTVPAVLRAPLGRMLDPRPELRPSAAAVLGGLDGTQIAPVVPVRPASRPARRTLPRLLARLVGDPRPATIRKSRRRRAGGVAAGLVAVAVVTLVAIDLGTSGNPTAAQGPAATAAPTTAVPTTVCAPLPFRPCGSSVPAAHTDGRTCDPGWYDLDGREVDGCEAHSNYVAGTTLVKDVAVRANLVPASARDSFPTHVSGDALNLCWGSLHVTLTAPVRTAERLTVWNGASEVASALSADGAPAVATVHKPSCFGSDSEDLRVTVEAVGAAGGSSAKDFTLTRDGGW